MMCLPLGGCRCSRTYPEKELAILILTPFKSELRTLCEDKQHNFRTMKREKKRERRQFIYCSIKDARTLWKKKRNRSG